MQVVTDFLKRYKILAGLFVVFIVLYIWQVLTTNPSKASLQRLHITGTQLHEISLAVAIPYIIIWLIGLVGFMSLDRYAKALGDSKDGQAFRIITRGVLWLVMWLPISVLASGMASKYYGTHPGLTADLIRLVNYINILLVLPAFYYVYEGSKALVTVARLKAHGLSQRQSMLFVAFTVLYVFLALSDQARQVPHGTEVATYYLPDWITVTTILIPRVLTWFIGLAAVANIILYRRKVKGTFYRMALRHRAAGPR